MITIEKTDFGSEAVNKYIETAADGTIYHHSNILRAIHDTFGHQTVSLAAKNQTGVIGTVPLVHMNSRLFGNFLISVPFFNYGGVCADNDEARQALIDAAVDEARIRDCVHLELRHTHRQFEKLQHKQAKVAMLLDLPESEEELWSGFKSKLRSQIRKPEKEGVTTKVGRLDLVDDFYHVFSMNMRDLGTPVYTKKLFINVLNAFPKSSWIIAAYKDDLPLAAGFLLGFRNTIEIPWASSLREYNRLAANMLDASVNGRSPSKTAADSVMGNTMVAVLLGGMVTSRVRDSSVRCQWLARRPYPVINSALANSKSPPIWGWITVCL